jgi:hypothetical protein
MADVVHVVPPDFTKAAATVAQHIETAATPPRVPAPHPAPASPVDVAAAGAAGAIHTKIGSLSGQLAPKGPAIQQAGTSAAAALAAQDAANAARMPSVPNVPTPSAPSIQALDSHFKTAPPPPPPPPSDPLGRLGLPPYNPASLPPGEARRVYKIGELRIAEQDQQLAKQGVSLEERAKAASASRSALRSWIRSIQENQGDAANLNQTEPNMSWDEVVKKYQDQGLTGDDLWRKIIEKSSASRASVDDTFGVDPSNPGELPPIRPTNPNAIISAPPDLPPIAGSHPPTPVGPTILDHPPSTALPPTVLDHPPLPPWLADPSPPGFQISPTQPPPIFNWDMPDPPPVPAPMPPPGPPVGIYLPSITAPDLHAPTITPPTPQEAAGGIAAVLAALAALGAFLANGPKGLLAGGGG